MSNRPDIPIYIPSKGRSTVRLTSDTLIKSAIPHYIVVEEQEYTKYQSAVGSGVTVLVLDKSYQDNYDTCDELGDEKSKGPGPARNFIWDHSSSNGHEWHWTMDDNIRAFHRLRKNKRNRVYSRALFSAMEEFCQRYTNVAMAGPNYMFFAKQRQKLPPFITNTRIYSCNLIRNDIPFRWRGRYNEDTILSLDALKAGWCTVQFNAFLQDKVATQTLSGGNTQEFYALDGTLPKSQMQVAVHPDVSKLVWKYGRWHHHVDYKKFKNNRLKRKPDYTPEDSPNEYGMKLKKAK